MSYDWLHHDISFGEIKRLFSPVQRLSWFHYVIAALVAYLTTWLAGFFWDFVQHRILSHLYSRFHPEQDSYDFSLSMCLWLTIPAAINPLILLPFLRFPVRRRIAYACLFVVWIFIFWFFQADTR
jgi:hypothetical protein